MSTRACGICGGDLVLRHRGSGAPLTAERLSPTCHTPGAHGDLFACRSCGTVQQPSAPTGAALVALYREMRDDAYLEQERGRRATARRLLELVERHAPTGRLLDVGCGPGLFLDEARGRGWSVAGLEPSHASRRHATERFALDVRDATLEDLDRARDGGLEAITLIDVIEHLDDPAEALRRCAGLLAYRGVVLVVTPDPASGTARLAGRRWWGLLPAHTYLLPRRTLRELLRRAGLEPVADEPLRRSFTLRYWLAGLGERSGIAGAVVGALHRVLPAHRLVTLSLGDERVIVARRAAEADVPAPSAGALRAAAA